MTDQRRDTYPRDTLTAEELAAVGGNAVRRLVQGAGKPSDAYILIVVRNTPEIDAGSDQVLASNVSDEQNLLEILRWHAWVIEQRIAQRSAQHDK